MEWCQVERFGVCSGRRIPSGLADRLGMKTGEGKKEKMTPRFVA